MKAGWATIALRDLCAIARGGSPRPIKQFITDDPNGINWIKIGDSERGGRYIDSTEERIKPEGVARSRFVKAGSFLLSNSMSFGRPYILRTNGCIHDGWLVLEPDYTRVDQDFLYHVLGSPTVFNQFDRLAAGSTVRNLNIGLVEGVTIPLPPLEVQQQIVAVLDEAFEGLTRARAHAEANLQNARELRQTALFGALLRTSSGEKVKEGWDDMTVKDLCTVRTGKKDVNQGNPIGAYPFFTCAKQHTYSDEWSFDGEALLIAGNGDVGNLSYCNGRFEAYQRTYVLMDFNGVVPHFLYYVFEAGLKPMLFSQKLGNTMPYIKKGMITDFPVSLPSLEEQLTIVAALDNVCASLDDITAIYRSKLHDLDALRQSLLQKAFAGELT